MIKKMIKKIGKVALQMMPLRNYIIFESAPVYADNTRAVYDEMVRRGIHKHYKLFWTIKPEEERLEKIDHAQYLTYPERTILEKLKVRYYLYSAKALISCNQVLATGKKDQYAICLMHGAPLKNVRSHYTIPKEVDEILSFSSYLSPYEEMNTGADQKKMRVLGFPRNDILFDSQLDVHKLFDNRVFSKLIYWMPTYRQHKNGNLDVSSIAMPILCNEVIAEKVNEAARSANILLIAKPHFAQDVSRIKTMNLSNLLFIDDKFLADHKVLNYELLGKADALLTDYSSVYYDYLLLHRPIGLCWDDYEEYKAREGFIVDMETVMAGGEKIYSADDLCGFISRLGVGIDIAQKAREKVCSVIHDHRDNQATMRTVDLIMRRLGTESKNCSED